MLKPNRILGPGKVCALIVASSALLFSQSSSVGSLTGTVLGSDKKPVAGAVVQVDTGRGVKESRTDEKGRFLLAQLLPGSVQLQVTHNGFHAFKTRATVYSDQNTVLNIPLASISEATIEVIAALPPDVGVDPATAIAGRNFSMEEIANMPVIGDPYSTFMTLMPGTPSGGYNVHGSEDGSNGYSVNGVESRSANGGTQMLQLNRDLIEQFNVLTSGISAKYGRMLGTMVNTTTKSGTNTFEGSIRQELTSTSWNALPKPQDFANSDEVPRRVTDTQSYTVLGPVIKDKLFFAVGYQTQTPSVTTVVKAAPISKLFPSWYYTATSQDSLKDLKLDWLINTDNRLSGTWSEHLADASNGTSARGLTSIDTTNGPSRTKTGFQSLDYTGNLTSNFMVNVILSETTNQSGGPGTGSPGGTGIVTWKDHSHLGSGDLYDNGTVPSTLNKEEIHTLGVNLTWLLADHTLEAGLQRYSSRIQTTGRYAGADAGYLSMPPSQTLITFNGFTSNAPASMAAQYRDMVVGNTAATELVVFSPLQGGSESDVNSLYANDRWTLNPHWAFNLGLRYDKSVVYTHPEGYEFPVSTLTPRLAAFYDVQGNGKHVVSFNAAEYSGQFDVGTISSASVSTSVPVATYAYYGVGNGSDALNANGSINWNVWGKAPTQLGANNPYYVTPNPLTHSLVTVDPNMKSPRARELSLNYHYSDSKQSAQISILKKLQDNYTGLRFNGAPGTAPGMAQEQYWTDPGMTSRYEDLEIQYKRSLSEAWTIGGNITWSYTYTNAGQGIGTSSRNEYGSSISNNAVDPYGPEPGQWSSSSTPFTAHLDSSYKHSFGAAGTLIVSLTGNYWSKSFEGYRDFYGPTDASVQSNGYPSSVDILYPDQKLWWPEQYNFNLHLGYEFAIWRKATAFTSLDILNLFNHQQPMYLFHNTGLTDGTNVYQSAYGTPALPTGWYNNPNLRAIGYNTGTSPDQMDGGVGAYTNPRAIQIKFGQRF